jgi:hypothetical protein
VELHSIALYTFAHKSLSKLLLDEIVVARADDGESLAVEAAEAHSD